MDHRALREVVVTWDAVLQSRFHVRLGILIVFGVDGVPQVASPFDDAQRATILQELLEQHASEQHGCPMRVRLEPV